MRFTPGFGLVMPPDNRTSLAIGGVETAITINRDVAVTLAAFDLQIYAADLRRRHFPMDRLACPQPTLAGGMRRPNRWLAELKLASCWIESRSGKVGISGSWCTSRSCDLSPRLLGVACGPIRWSANTTKYFLPPRHSPGRRSRGVFQLRLRRIRRWRCRCRIRRAQSVLLSSTTRRPVRWTSPAGGAEGRLWRRWRGRYIARNLGRPPTQGWT